MATNRSPRRLFGPKARVLLGGQILQAVQKPFGEAGTLLWPEPQCGGFQFLDAHHALRAGGEPRISALRPSVLWLFQRIAPRLGAERMTKWLTTFEYGNRDVSGPITEYWTNGRLQISALEQVAFLRKFYRGALPVQPQHVAAVRNGLEQTPGTVENSLGVHPLPGDWQNARLNAKTGATTTERYRVSWLVGLLTSRGRDYVCASVVWWQKGDVDALEGARLAARTFIDFGLVPGPSPRAPDLSEDEVERRLGAWLQERPGAERGDGAQPGTP